MTWIFTTAAFKASTEYACGIRTRLIVDSSYNKKKERRRGDEAELLRLNEGRTS
jgi:hypothetical protein